MNENIKILLVTEDENLIYFLKKINFLNLKIKLINNLTNIDDELNIFYPDLILLDEFDLKENLFLFLKSNKSKFIEKNLCLILILNKYDNRVDEIIGDDFFFDYILKPIKENELCYKIKNLLKIKQVYKNSQYKNFDSEQCINYINTFVGEANINYILYDDKYKIIATSESIRNFLGLEKTKLADLFLTDLFGYDILNKEKIQIFSKERFLVYLKVSHKKLYDNLNVVFLEDITSNEFLINIFKQSEIAFTSDEYIYENNFFYYFNELKKIFEAQAVIFYIYNEGNYEKHEIIDGEMQAILTADNLKIYKDKIFLESTFVFKKGLEVKFYMEDNLNNVKNLLILPIINSKKKFGFILLLNSKNTIEKLKYYEFAINVILKFLCLYCENIVLYSKITKDNLYIKTMIKVLQIINSTIQYDKLLDLIIYVISEYIGFDTIILMLFNKKNQNLEIVRALNIKKELINNYNIMPIKKEEIYDYKNEENLIKNEKFKKICINFIPLVFPLNLKGETIGYLAVKEGAKRPFYLKALILFIEYVVNSIENTYLFDQLVKKNQELIEASNNLKIAEKKLIIQEKFAMLGKFSNYLAHEIRNPLTVLLSSIKNINNLTEEERNIILKQMENKILDIDIILKEMMNFSKDIKLKFEEFSPIEVVNNILDFLIEKLKHNKILVKKDFSYKLNIVADKTWLERALLNIIINAIDEMKNGGTLTISIKDSSNDINFLISDTGSGIPEQLKDKIFEPFNSFKRVGTGLGLHNVKKIIEMHGGNVNFKTSEKGTTFIISLPKFNN